MQYFNNNSEKYIIHLKIPSTGYFLIEEIVRFLLLH